MIVAAACMLGLDWCFLGKTRYQLLGTAVCPVGRDWRGRVALVLLGWGAMLIGLGFISVAGGELGNPH